AHKRGYVLPGTRLQGGAGDGPQQRASRRRERQRSPRPVWSGTGVYGAGRPSPRRTARLYRL
ncbi:MAG: Homoserine O-acetyltransferase, partial [uncultured Rubrobacteraceae bacterium]